MSRKSNRATWLFMMAAPLLSSVSMAADSWIEGLTLLQVITGADSNGQYVQLVVSQPVSNPAACGNQDTYVSRTIPHETLELALNAINTHRSLRLLVRSFGCDVTLDRPLFTSIGVQ